MLNKTDLNKINSNNTATQYLRLHQIIGETGLISISRSKFYQDIKNGVYPPPIKLGRVSVWRASDIYDAIENAAKIGGEENV